MSKKRIDFVNTEKVFALNPRSRAHTETVGAGSHKILIVDGFYKHPALVREFFLRSPVPVWKLSPDSRNFKDYYDCRHHVNLPFGFTHVTEFLARLVQAEFGLKVRFPNSAVSNVFQLIHAQPPGTSAVPHNDASLVKSKHQPVNALVYLNTKEECRGGTALYRHLATGRESLPMSSQKAQVAFNRKYIDLPELREDGSTYWCEYGRYWERFHLIKMKFNRLVIFPSEIFHAAWHEPGWFMDYPRINQVFFSIPE
jgi:hypothetical protein